MLDRSIRIGVDVGGTFTDLVLADAARNVTRLGKVLTTPDDPSRGVIEGLNDLLMRANVAPAAVTQIIHGTTVVTNAIIERRGARLGLITTRGFRDVLEIGREVRHDLYDPHFEKPAALVARRLRLTVAERVDAAGRVRLPLDENDVSTAIETLRAADVEAVAVMFLHSYRNPRHEERAGALIAEAWPDIPVSLSSRIAPEIGEYERAVTTTGNAYVQPLAARYLRNLERELRRAGFSAPLSLMLSSGGLAGVEEAIAAPIHLIESGPAAGAMAAAGIARSLGLERALAFDMGGTTAKLSLIENGAPDRERRFEAARVHRMRKGSGLPLAIPVIDLIEIGAGGGSIAELDVRGALKVGPRSAGACPGPVSYGRGGLAPTVTDADLVLGLISPQNFLGGRLALKLDAATDALTAKLATSLRLTPVEAARGVHALVNETMASAARTHASEKGHDPATFALIAFGGAGPVHACDLAHRLKIDTVIVPPGAGVMSALGMIASPPMIDLTRTAPQILSDLDEVETGAMLGEMACEARARLNKVGLDESPARILRRVDMRYRGQGHAVTVDLPDGDISKQSMIAAYEAVYARLFGRTIPGVPIEIITWRVTALGASQPAPPLSAIKSVLSSDGIGRRNASFDKSTWVDCPVFSRARLPAGFTSTGPALIEEEETTSVIGPGANWRIDDALNLVISLSPSAISRME